MAQTKKVDSMDDIARQACQGSVAAIIQLLNENLAASGVRTRAILDDRQVLQLLCEAATVEQLEQSKLVEQVRDILEAIAPRRIRRVNINSRIVREQQLLWLEEINRDPENQLLWSQEIILKKPNIFKRLTTTTQNSRSYLRQPENFPKRNSRLYREKRIFWWGILVGGATLLGIFIVSRLVLNQPQNLADTQPESLPSPKPSEITANSSNQPPVSPVGSPSVVSDPFAEAVRLAEKASASGRGAKSSAEWLDLAAKWQRASDLMASVPSTMPSRYQIAQTRVILYRQNSEAALKEAQKMRSSQ